MSNSSPLILIPTLPFLSIPFTIIPLHYATLKYSHISPLLVTLSCISLFCGFPRYFSSGFEWIDVFMKTAGLIVFFRMCDICAKSSELVKT